MRWTEPFRFYTSVCGEFVGLFHETDSPHRPGSGDRGAHGMGVCCSWVPVLHLFVPPSTRQIGKCVKETDISIMKLRASWNVRLEVGSLCLQGVPQTSLKHIEPPEEEVEAAPSYIGLDL